MTVSDPAIGATRAFAAPVGAAAALDAAAWDPVPRVVPVSPAAEEAADDSIDRVAVLTALVETAGTDLFNFCQNSTYRSPPLQRKRPCCKGRSKRVRTGLTERHSRR